MKATIKNLNKYLKGLTPHFEIVKGDGYFWFCGVEGDTSPPDFAPNSIFVCYLSHMPYSKWTEAIDGAVAAWREEEAL